MFPLLLFLHLVAVALLFSGMGIELAMLLALHRATTVGEVRAAVTNGPLIGPLMGGGAMLLIIMGVAMVYVGGFGWQAWVAVAAAVTIVLTVMGPLVNGRGGQAVHAMAFETPEGPITPQLHAAPPVAVVP